MKVAYLTDSDITTLADYAARTRKTLVPAAPVTPLPVPAQVA